MNNSLFLHYGCGTNFINGWLNIDNFNTLDFPAGLIKHREEAQIFRMDITRSHLFEDNTIAGAYCEDVIEHLTQSETIFFFTEVFRVLKSGGIFRVSCPSFEGNVVHSRSVDDWIHERYQIYERWNHKHLPTDDFMFRIGAVTGFNVLRSKYQDTTARFSELDSRPNQQLTNHFFQYFKPENVPS